MKLKAGFAREELKIDLPFPTIYSKCGGELADTMVSPVYSSVTAWEYEDTRGAFVTLDLLSVPCSFTGRLRNKLKDLQFAPQAVLVSATHTHTAPTFVRFRGCQETEPFLKEITRATLKAAERASKDLLPARLYHGKTDCFLNVNRREIGRVGQVNDVEAPSGEVDPEVVVLCFRKEKGDILLVNYAGHPLTTTGKPRIISADYPGALVKYVEEQRPGSRCQFLQGASGNVNIKIHGEPEVTGKVAEILGNKVLETTEKLKEIQVDKVDAVVKKINLPLDIETTLKEAKDLLAGEEVPDSPLFNQAMKQWAEEAIEAARSGETPNFAEAEIQKVSLGSFSIITLPGEPFVETGKALKHAGANLTVGYANTADVGYIPTREAFEEGGYEPDIAYRWYGIWKYRPDVESIVVKNGRDIL